MEPSRSSASIWALVVSSPSHCQFDLLIPPFCLILQIPLQKPWEKRHALLPNLDAPLTIAWSEICTHTCTLESH